MIGEDPDSPDVEEIWALIARDVLFEHWKEISDNQKQQIYLIDDEIKSKKELVARSLPSKSSTPQARAEGRWWWFLNENQS